MSERQQYVVGLALDSSLEQVALILKQTGPDCVIGNWNGIGGKIADGESPLEAMVREFREEAGVDIPENCWEPLAVLHGDSYDLHFFSACTDRVLDVRTVEAEEVKLWKCSEAVGLRNVMQKVRWMVPLLQDQNIDSDLGHLTIYH